MEVQCGTQTRGYRCQRWFVPDGSKHCPYHREMNRLACAKHRSTESFKASKKRYRESKHGKEHMSEEQAIRYSKDKIKYRLTTEMGHLLAGRRKYTCLIKHTAFESTEDFRSHISSTWQGDMNWSNFGQGQGKWSVGHKIPKSHYDFSNSDDVKRCWSKPNVAAQWWCENKAQGSTLPPDSVRRSLILADVEPLGWGWAWV